MDESAIQVLKPGFKWGDIDQAMEEIVAENLSKRSLQSRVESSRSGNQRGL